MGGTAEPVHAPSAEDGRATTVLQRAAFWMAGGTAVSRLTGVLRVFALAYVLGFFRLADGYNLANTTPNMLYDVVLGGVLSATFIPVFVDRLTTRSDKEAWGSISAIVSISAVILVGATVLFFIGAPLIIDAFTAFDHTKGVLASTNLGREKDVATSLLRWFVPQIALYGFIALATALLNTRRRFVAPMWVPIANNLVCIAVLLWFHEVAGPHPSLLAFQQHPNQLLILGLGTTLGVAVQALLLLPALWRAKLSGLRWHWDPANEAVRTVVRLGSWTFGFVLANQIALFVVIALAVSAGGGAPVSSYTYAYTFMQMPYAVVAVSVMAAVQPDLAERWTEGDIPAFLRRLSGGMRAMLAIIIPASVGLLLLAKPAVALFLGHGAGSAAQTATTGEALAMFAVGLPGFCTFLYVVRVLQAMQRTKVAFWLYLCENACNIILAIAFVHPLGVRGLALSLSIAYTLAAIVGVYVLRSWLGPLGTPRVWAPLRRVGIATAVMAVAVAVVLNLSGSTSGFGLLVRVGAAVVIGLVVYLGTPAALTRRAGRRGPQRPPEGTSRPRPAPPPAPAPAPGDPEPAGVTGPVASTHPVRTLDDPPEPADDQFDDDSERRRIWPPP